jgi:cobalt-zinc-cadmium efflux system membrane fusion protein
MIVPGFRNVLSIVLLVCSLLGGELRPAGAHEGHDHDKPAPLALPIAPRVVAVTPDFELVGVSSGRGRLTVFLHSFATNEPIKGARLVLSADDKSEEAKAEGDGVFSVAAPWIDAGDNLDLVFTLTLADGTQDLLTGSLQQVDAQTAAPQSSKSVWQLSGLMGHRDTLLAAAGGLAVGILLTLLLGGGRSRQMCVAPENPSERDTVATDPLRKSDAAEITTLRRSSGVIALAAFVVLASQAGIANAADATLASLPSVPSTMATDLAQRTPDGTLFVPKATQHLLSIRTALTTEAKAPLSTELAGTIVPGPGHFGRVQPGVPGRIEAAPGGLAYVGRHVTKGEVLAYVQMYIEAADKANIESLIAETEERIKKNATILSRFEALPGSVPQVRVDEVRGELEALRRKRAELVPSVARRQPVVAPIGGVVSLSNATIGQIVDARDVLFEIVDPSELWVEAVHYGKDTLGELSKAFAVTRSEDQIPLRFMGRGLALRQQAAVLTFKMEQAGSKIAIGAPVTVVLQSTSKVDGFVLPSSAIVRGQTGLPTVWIKTDAERFEPQEVKTSPLDGSSVVVTAGLKADQRVVTEGVTLLNQVR